jgi:hypothetical protein
MRTIVGSVLKYLASPPQIPHNMRSFIKKIIINRDIAKIQYHLPMPLDGKMVQSLGVLPIEHVGGAGVSIGRTFEFEFKLSL